MTLDRQLFNTEKLVVYAGTDLGLLTARQLRNKGAYYERIKHPGHRYGLLTAPY